MTAKAESLTKATLSTAYQEERLRELQALAAECGQTRARLEKELKQLKTQQAVALDRAASKAQTEALYQQVLDAQKALEDFRRTETLAAEEPEKIWYLVHFITSITEGREFEVVEGEETAAEATAAIGSLDDQRLAASRGAAATE